MADRTDRTASAPRPVRTWTSLRPGPERSKRPKAGSNKPKKEQGLRAVAKGQTPKMGFAKAATGGKAALLPAALRAVLPASRHRIPWERKLPPGPPYFGLAQK
ncbi:hypothetical protein JCM15519_09700 [Fundidesulfovibrio butyratiphilus]